MRLTKDNFSFSPEGHHEGRLSFWLICNTFVLHLFSFFSFLFASFSSSLFPLLEFFRVFPPRNILTGQDNNEKKTTMRLDTFLQLKTYFLSHFWCPFFKLIIIPIEDCVSFVLSLCFLVKRKMHYFQFEWFIIKFLMLKIINNSPTFYY